MSVLRSPRSRFAARIMALFLPILMMPVVASAANAAAPPTTQPDGYAKYWESKFYTTLPVLNNDASGDGGTLTVYDYTKSSSPDSPVRINTNGQLQIKLCACDDGKTITFQYRANEADAISAWTSVTVQVKHVYLITSHWIPNHKARFVNKNPFRAKVKIWWHLYYHNRKNQWVSVPANGSAVIKRDTHGHAIQYSAFRRPHNWKTPCGGDFV
jgi:hypothetical protein